MSFFLRDRVSALCTGPTQIHWCDEERFRDENAEGVSPGQYLNPFGWWVVGTTIGGNVIVLRQDDARVYFADHTWYHVSGVHYQDVAGSGKWLSLPLTAQGVETSLVVLASSPSGFLERSQSGEIDAVLDRID